MTAPYVDPADLTPLLTSGGEKAYPYRPALSGRVTAWNAVTRANTVKIGGTTYTNLPVLSSAEAALAVDVTVLCIPFQDIYAVVGRLRIP